MSEPNEDITEQPQDIPRTTDITNKPARREDDFDPARFVLPPQAGTLWSKVVIGALLLGIVVCGAGLVLAAVAKVREAAGRMAHVNNCKQMCLTVNNIAGNTTTGNIPPAFGPFPAGTSEPGQTFFTHILPYIDSNNYIGPTGAPINPTIPIKTYIAPADPYNPGTTSLISYTANATVLGWANDNHASVDVTVDGKTYSAASNGGVASIQPRFPRSFGGRTSGIILVAERSARSGATWSYTTGNTLNNTSITPTTNPVPWVEEVSSNTVSGGGSTSPLYTNPASWPAAGNSVWGMNGNCTALSSTGCIVGMGDGSSRVVTQRNAAAAWSWAMNPNNIQQQPSGW